MIPDATPPPDASGSPRSSLTRLLAPIQAELSPAPHGFTLTLDPMPAAHALAVLAGLCPGPSAEILLSSPGQDVRYTTALAALARRMDIPAVAHAGGRHLVLDGSRWSALPAVQAAATVEAVLVDGPIEAADVAAIARARARGVTPLAAEVRAVAALQVTHDRLVRLQCRDQDAAMAFVVERLRRYLAAVIGAPIDEIEPPEDRLVDRVLVRTGYIQIRPIETEVYSTAVDVGIVTDRSAAGPAETSLVFDRYGNSWHGD